MEFEARYFDGESAGERQVKVRLEKAAVAISADGRSLAVWPVADIRIVRDTGNAQVASLHKAGSDARLNVSDPDIVATMIARLPSPLKRDRPSTALKRTSLWTAAALGAVLLMLFVILPGLADRLAVLIPPRQAERIGALVVTQANSLFGTSEKAPFCTGATGEQALAKMTNRLARDLDLPFPLRVRVARNSLPNAFAAPGGHVVLFAGLLDLAETPEEVAAVLAHEIGHVHARDGMRLVLRAAGSAGLLSLILGDISGGLLVVVTEQLLQASYSRTAEAAADDFAHHMMADAGLPPDALAQLFDRLAEETPDLPDMFRYFESHPDLGERANAARAFHTQLTAYEPVLTASEWQDLQAICGS